MPDTQPYQPGLRAANAAPRCNHVRYNGQQCGCPALNGDTRCRFHVHADPKHFAGLPMVEDAASIQLAVMRILRALEFGSLDTKTAALMLYGLQIASSNLKRLEAFFAVPTAQAEEEREQSLAEELLKRLDDQEFLRQLSAAGREEEIIPDIKASIAEGWRVPARRVRTVVSPPDEPRVNGNRQPSG